MKFSEYRAACMRTAGDISPEVVALGLCGEAGEVADLVKKHIGHGHPLDRDKLIEELGDLLWYVAVAYYEEVPDQVELTYFKCAGAATIGARTLDLCGSVLMKYYCTAIGDINAISEFVGSNINEVAERNIAKLKKRYPDGFSTECSMNREESK